MTGELGKISEELQAARQKATPKEPDEELGESMTIDEAIELGILRSAVKEAMLEAIDELNQRIATLDEKEAQLTARETALAEREAVIGDIEEQVADLEKRMENFKNIVTQWREYESEAHALIDEVKDQIKREDYARRQDHLSQVLQKYEGL